MNKTELVAAMVKESGLTKKDAEAAVKAFTDVVAKGWKGSVSWIWYIRSF